MSTMSARVSRRMRSARSAGTAGVPEVSALRTSRSALAGGVHATCGAGEAPDTPETRGVPTHPLRSAPVASSTRPGLRRITAWPRGSRPGGLHHGGIGGLVSSEARAHPLAPDGQGAPGLTHGLGKSLPALHAVGHRPAEEVRRHVVIVVPVGRSADALDHALAGQHSRIGAGAGLADPERVGELIEGPWIVAQQQIAEDPAGDARLAFVLEQGTHPIGEVAGSIVHRPLMASSRAAARSVLLRSIQTERSACWNGAGRSWRAA